MTYTGYAIQSQKEKVVERLIRQMKEQMETENPYEDFEDEE